jgi:glycine cleavage system aminomethyltransferase T
MKAFHLWALKNLNLKTTARVFRISFSGELAFEVNVMSDYGEEMWDEIMSWVKIWYSTLWYRSFIYIEN